MQEPNSFNIPTLSTDTVFTKHFSQIKSICTSIAVCWRFIPRQLDTNDLVQEALIKIYLALKQYDTTKPLRCYLYEVARNAMSDACKRGGKHAFFDLDPAYLSYESSRMSIDEQGKILQSDLYRACDSALSIRQREIIYRVFGLRSRPESDSQETASALGLSRQTISSEKRKALNALRNYLDQ